MEFNAPYTTRTPNPASCFQSHSCSFSLPYTSSSPQASDSYAVPETSEIIDALTSDVEQGNQHGSLERFLGRKKNFAAKSVQDILGLIYERESIKYELAHAIDYEQCHLGTQLLEIDDWRTGDNPQLDKTRGQLERNIIALNQEKRREETACWRDVTRLKSELREVLREFDGEHHKNNLLSSPWKSENSAGN